MATTYYNDIQALYVAYFNRPADPDGLAFWEKAVEAAKGSTAAVAAEFAKSAEYNDEYAGMSNAQIVNQVYQNLFGRTTTGDTGAQFWINGLNNKVISIVDVVTAVAAGAQGTDKTAYANKVTAAAAFTTAIDTPAEKAGYSGDEANAVAKEWLAGITTNVSLTAAIAPTALANTVNEAVTAGTPFTLSSGLTALSEAQEARADFLAGLDLDDDEDTDTTAADVEAALKGVTVGGVHTNGAIDIVGAQIGGTIDFTKASAGVQAALIEEHNVDLAETLATAESNLADAQGEAAKTAGLANAIAAQGNAADAADAAADAAEDAEAAQAAALAAYNVKNTAVTVKADGTVTGLIIKDGSTLKLATGVKEADKPGVTELLKTIIASQAAEVEKTAADEGLVAAQLEVNLLDVGGAAETTAISKITALMDATAVGTIEKGVPTAAQVLAQWDIYKDAADGITDPVDPKVVALQNFEKAVSDFNKLNSDAATADANNPLSTDVATYTKAVTDATKAIENFDEATVDLTEAQGNYDQLQALNAAVKAANDAFAAHDFKAPISIGDTVISGVGTAGSDIFVVEGSKNVSISSFARVGDDALFVGGDFTLNTKATLNSTTGKITGGDNTKLEVFFFQDGNNAKVYLETAAYGSDSTSVAEQVITLTGVNIADLHLDNGIITVA